MRFRWLPNGISIFRIFLILPILFLINARQYKIALVFFIVAVLSDIVDGYLAKKYDWRSHLGTFLDPLADKLLISSTFIILAYSGNIPFWLMSAVIFRDICIAFGALFYYFFIESIRVKPTGISKLNTVLESLFVLFILSKLAYGLPGPSIILLFGSAVLVTVVISGVDYIISWSLKVKNFRNRLRN